MGSSQLVVSLLTGEGFSFNKMLQIKMSQLRYNREEVVASLGREINLNPPLTLGQLPDTTEELLKLDQVTIGHLNELSLYQS